MESRLQQQNDYLQSIPFTSTHKQSTRPSKSSTRYAPYHKGSNKVKVIAYATEGDLTTLNKSCISDLRYSNIINTPKKPVKIVPYQSYKNQQRGFVQMIKNTESRSLISSQIKWLKTSKALSNYPQQLKQRQRKPIIMDINNILTETENYNQFRPQLQIRIASPVNNQKDKSIGKIIVDHYSHNRYYLPIQPHSKTIYTIKQNKTKYQNMKSRLAKAVKANIQSNNLRNTLSSRKMQLGKRQKSQRAQVQSFRDDLLSVRTTRKNNNTIEYPIQ